MKFVSFLVIGGARFYAQTEIIYGLLTRSIVP